MHATRRSRSVPSSARRPARVGRLASVAVVGFASTLLGGCDLQSLFNDLFGTGDLSGQNAFVHLEPDTSRGAATNMQAVFEVVDWQARGGDSLTNEQDFRPPTQTLDLLRSTARPRQNIRTSSFTLFNVSSFAPRNGDENKRIFTPVDTSRLRNEYVVPNLNAIPVRNQGGRGTCAAFAGIGQIEYAVLRQNPSLSTIDLSEQRFYYASKPECQQTGCTERDAGSWWGTGLDASVAASTFDIPLERDCPYNSNQDPRNELQVPQPASCSNGAVRVARISYVTQPADIIRVLEEDGLPVPFASPLSQNYFSNNGLITLAAAGSAGSGMHAGGHAYMIVGYKLLPNMPEEGGMCFLIKNSWGTGWGANGYSCMTLAWMQEWHFGYAIDNPMAVTLELRDDIASGGGGGGGDQDQDQLPDWVDEDSYVDETIDYDNLDDDTPIPVPPPVELDWRTAGLRGPDDRFYRAEIADVTGGLAVRGIIRGQGIYTGVVELGRSGNLLIFDEDEVGRIDGNDVTLCTGAYDLLCALRFDTRTNRLYIEFLYPEFRSVKQSEVAGRQWQSLIPLPINLDLQFLQPQSALDVLLSPVYIRGTDTLGSPTEPIRLVLDFTDIKAMGQQVGSIAPSNLGLCTGGFRSNCSMFADDNKLLVVPGWGVR